MSKPFDLQLTLEGVCARLDAIDKKVETMSASWRKAMEWIGQMGEHVRSLDDFREEVRASLEPLFNKLDNVDDVMRIMRHACRGASKRSSRCDASPAEKCAGRDPKCRWLFCRFSGYLRFIASLSLSAARSVNTWLPERRFCISP